MKKTMIYTAIALSFSSSYALAGGEDHVALIDQLREDHVALINGVERGVHGRIGNIETGVIARNTAQLENHDELIQASLGTTEDNFEAINLNLGEIERVDARIGDVERGVHGRIGDVERGVHGRIDGVETGVIATNTETIGRHEKTINGALGRISTNLHETIKNKQNTQGNRDIINRNSAQLSMKIGTNKTNIEGNASRSFDNSAAIKDNADQHDASREYTLMNNDRIAGAIDTNASGIVDNTGLIGNNSTAILDNSEAIVDNLLTIVDNGEAIDHNSDAIYGNTTAIGGNTTAIVDNLAAIKDNADQHDASREYTLMNNDRIAGDIDTNSADISTNKSQSETNKINVVANEQNIAANNVSTVKNAELSKLNNKGLLAVIDKAEGNTTEIGKINTSLTKGANLDELITNRKDINKNHDGIVVNADNVDELQNVIFGVKAVDEVVGFEGVEASEGVEAVEAVASVEAVKRHVGLIEKVSVNATEIKSNTTAIGDNSGRIDTNLDSTKVNASGVEAKLAATNTNASGVATNSGRIDTNTYGIDTNATEIKSNKSSITANSGRIDTNANDIKSLEDDLFQQSQKIANLDDRMDATNASLHAVTNARPFVTNGQTAIGLGIGGAGDAQALAFGLSHSFMDTGFSASLTVNATTGSYKEVNAGAGVQYAW